ncbi:UDP-N-acetylmuramoyl-L-alanine--D-glutamate ligase [Helicobacter cynogastricus]|uniref:UDP-N-acetylmuramoyl-L-alanine--D-glutamate ligase n=1 Tax=Helicobacter cynogastricus TaxID=329937 RepID=UPI000CF029C9|nr:UDP-N-acetylmuramoyl-L-alanine--D-glutamate ligase [Helicobacter cynogastricus]
MISLLGYGRTNRAFANYLHRCALPYRIYDDATLTPKSDLYGQPLLPSTLFDPQISCLEIVSPGFPPKHPLVLASEHLISEYDYVASRVSVPKTCFVSGTNGKTTTTEMLGLLCAPFGSVVGGNIGTPLINLFPQAPLWILETSSFSLHYTQRYAPHYYVLLPLAQDHLSWHGSYEAYVEAKLKPLRLMDKKSPVFLQASLRDHVLVREAKDLDLIFYEDSNHLAKNMGLDSSRVRFKEPFLLDALLALSATKLMTGQVDYDRLNSYTLKPHRLEKITDSQGRTWINDSKATNVDATLKALACFTDSFVHLIVGGDTKGVDLTPLFEVLTGMQTRIYTIGASAHLMVEMANQYGVSALLCGDLAHAVDAIKISLKEDQVALLSPSAASLDQFSSYQERGDLFRACVLAP